jgi:hypothetical protein
MTELKLHLRLRKSWRVKFSNSETDQKCPLKKAKGEKKQATKPD